VRTSNPIFRGIVLGQTEVAHDGAMTLDGAVYRSILLLLCVIVPALWVWDNYTALSSLRLLITAIICLLGAAAIIWITIHRRHWAPITAPVYALMEGFAIGIVSARLEARYPGVAIQATALTFAALFCLLAAYRFGLIRVSTGFKTGLMVATSSVALFYGLSFALALFGVRRFTLFDAGVVGIIVNLVVVIIAALNLVVDFDFMQECARSDLPKYMEWYTALGLIVTLVWLYLEILRLMARARKAEEGH
jgi:uncharacterized YccA/Bax inhibitor family protein